MAKWTVSALALSFALTGPALGQRPISPVESNEERPYRFAVTPQAGPWLICVQTFKGPQAQMLAEELAELLMRDYKIPAYLYDKGRKEREEERARIKQQADQYWEMINKMRGDGLEPIGNFRYRTLKIPTEFAVLVGKPNRPLKDMETARDYLNDIRKLKPPPAKFASKAFAIGEDPDKPKETQAQAVYFNPFEMAMVVHNPSIPVEKQIEDPEKADKLLRDMNANESLSVLKCPKPWTLVVKVYMGQSVIAPPKNPSLLGRLFGKNEGEYLSAAAMQAHETAQFLRKMKPSFDAYVMHHRTYSLVTVGNYDRSDDPQLLAYQKSLAGLKLMEEKTGRLLETLNPQPLPMKIPR